MTENERVELELYIDTINALIGDFYVIALHHNIPLDGDDRVGKYYKDMIKYVHSLRKTTSYEDVLIAKRNIIAIKEKLVKLEVHHDI